MVRERFAFPVGGEKYSIRVSSVRVRDIMVVSVTKADFLHLCFIKEPQRITEILSSISAVIIHFKLPVCDHDSITECSGVRRDMIRGVMRLCGKLLTKVVSFNLIYIF